MVGINSDGYADPIQETRGGTNQSSYTQGDTLYASAANTLSKLAKNTSSTRYLANTGTSNAPNWDQVNLANGVTGTLPVANGGTGDATLTAYAVMCGGTTPTSAVQSIASVGTSGQVLTSNGAGALPTFQTAGASVIIQQVRTTGTTEASTSTVLPTDNTIPQNTEGAQLTTLAITPTNANSILMIEFSGYGVLAVASSANKYAGVALFQDSTANALAAALYTGLFQSGASAITLIGGPVSLRYYMTAGTTSSTTFKIRFGPGVSGTSCSISGDNSANLYGGKDSWTFTITEYGA